MLKYIKTVKNKWINKIFDVATEKKTFTRADAYLKFFIHLSTIRLEKSYFSPICVFAKLFDLQKPYFNMGIYTDGCGIHSPFDGVISPEALASLYPQKNFHMTTLRRHLEDELAFYEKLDPGSEILDVLKEAIRIVGDLENGK